MPVSDADYKMRLKAAKDRQAHRERLRSIEAAKQKREQGFSNNRTLTEAIIENYNKELDAKTQPINANKWKNTGPIGETFGSVVVPVANVLLKAQNMFGKASKDTIPISLMNNPLQKAMDPKERKDFQSKITEGLAMGGMTGGSEAGGKLFTALKQADKEALEELGYKIGAPTVDELAKITFGNFNIDPNLPAVRNLFSRSGVETIFKPGNVLNPDARGAGVEIAGKVNATVLSGYDRMIEEAQKQVKKMTGQHLTAHQIEELLGINKDQAVLFGEKIEDKGYHLSDEADAAARELQRTFQNTWQGAATGARILGQNAQREFSSGIFEYLTGSRFKNIGGQDDHIKSPTEAGTYIGQEILVPMLKKGETTVSDSASALAQEINKRTQNVGQIIRIPQPDNLNIGGVDFSQLGIVENITKRLGKDVGGILDESLPTFHSYMDKNKNIWDVPQIKEYTDWYNTEEALARQIKRLQDRIRGNFS